MSHLLDHLKALIEEGNRSLSAVTYRRMFGCDAYFAKGSIYALVWQTGRIGVRLPDQAAFDEAMAMTGAEPWVVPQMTKGMKHWVLLGEAAHDDADLLADWLRRAHALNAALPARATVKKKVKARPAKRPQTRRR